MLCCIGYCIPNINLLVNHEIQLFFYDKDPFVKATFQSNLSLSYPPQVILSSMIKECEIKVENRGMADAQGWEQTNSPIHTVTSTEPICVLWEAAAAASDGFKVVVKRNLEGEEVVLLWGEGSHSSVGTGPVLWVYSPRGRGEHIRVLEPHSLCGYPHSSFGKAKRAGHTVRAFLKDVSPILLTCVRGSLNREVCLYACKKCVYVCFSLGCVPPPKKLSV